MSKILLRDVGGTDIQTTTLDRVPCINEFVTHAPEKTGRDNYIVTGVEHVINPEEHPQRCVAIVWVRKLA